MERSLLFSTLFALGTVAQAAIAPIQRTSLYTHMVEVNAQWRVQDPAGMVGNAPVSFTTEADRIATHLHLVRERLMANTPEGLSADQLGRRLFLLTKLGNYADRGSFPQNYVLPYRNPVFIDPHGTACAVGQLMIESGHRDLAERISAEMNLRYVLDMPWPEIAAWANDEGFTPEELAWIQPGYPPNLPWVALGNGTNGRVTITKTLSNGDVLVCGDFTEAGGVFATHVAIWNGAYEALGEGLQGDVTSAVEVDGDLYVGGSFLAGTDDLARWDGSAWSYSTVFNGKYPHINALHVHDGVLYAAGEEVGFVGTTPLVKRFDGTNWVQIGSAFDATVLTLGSHDGMLVAGGMFSTLQGPTPPSVLHVGYFNGTEWMQLAEGLDATVRDLLDVNGTLYACGDLYENIAVKFGMARIGAAAGQWELLLPNHADYMPAGVGPTWIGSLAEYNGEIYFGGLFFFEQVMVIGSNLALFNGTMDGVEPLIYLDAQVNDVTLSDGHLIIGGDFAGLYAYIATLDLTTNVEDPTAALTTFSVAPNPSTDVIAARLPDTFGGKTTFRVIDASGRSIAVNATVSGTSARVDIKALPAGSYLLEATSQGRIITGRFVKE
ncbi:MAG: T9SS type A sorting domain-containing protein [Flavobacteriales bacterium]